MNYDFLDREPCPGCGGQMTNKVCMGRRCGVIWTPDLCACGHNWMSHQRLFGFACSVKKCGCRRYTAKEK